MKKKNNSIGSIAFSLVWLMLISSFNMAFMKVNKIDNPGDFWLYAKYKSNELHACFDDAMAKKGWTCHISLQVSVDSNGNPIPIDKNNSDDNTNNSSSDDLFSALGLDKIGDGQRPTFIPDNTLPQFNGLYAMNSMQAVNLETTYELLENIPIVDELSTETEYSRSDWKHWVPYDENHACWNIREEVLFRQATRDSIVFLDSEKNITTQKSQACYIKSGEWIDPWSGETFTSSSKIDIDHHVPLALAFESGAENFTKEEKEQYANDLDILVATSATQNRSKGAKSPSEWMPSDENSHCNYAKLYVYTLAKYNLKMIAEDKEVLKNALSSCPVN